MKAQESESMHPERIIRIDEAAVQTHIDALVRGSVEQTLNQLLDAEADRLVNAGRYERSQARKDTRAGHYQRTLHTTSGEVTLKVPKLRNLPFETAIIERYRRRESSVEEALVEMYLAGVSVRRVEDIIEALWGTKVSPSTVSKLNQKIYGRIEAWRNQRLQGTFPSVFLDGIVLKRSWAGRSLRDLLAHATGGGEVRNVSVLVAIAVNSEGYRQIIGVAEGAKEDKAGWSSFLKRLKERGLRGVRLFISDKCMGLVESLGEFYPTARWQQCVVHFYRNVFSVVPTGKVREVAAMLKAIHAQENREQALAKAGYVEEKLVEMKLATAARILRDGIEEIVEYMHFRACKILCVDAELEGRRTSGYIEGSSAGAVERLQKSRGSSRREWDPQGTNQSIGGECPRC